MAPAKLVLHVMPWRRPIVATCCHRPTRREICSHLTPARVKIVGLERSQLLDLHLSDVNNAAIARVLVLIAILVLILPFFHQCRFQVVVQVTTRSDFLLEVVNVKTGNVIIRTVFRVDSFALS